MGAVSSNPSRLRVVIYTPDRHLTYTARTPDVQGVGGGVTLRIRMAQAMAHLGHEVTLIGNVPRAHTYGGVKYLPLDQVPALEADVLLMSTSGGAVDLRPALSLSVRSRLRGILILGVIKPHGFDDVGYDYTVNVSNFLRRMIRDQWGVPSERCFVAYPGAFASRRRWAWSRPPARNPFRLIYTGHPTKGLEAAVGVLRILRRADRRFELHIFGGTRLWGEEDAPPSREPGVIYHGLVGQPRLLHEMQRSSVALHLQSIQEGSSLALVQAMAAGCIVMASPVGANVEPIESSRNGFLIRGDHMAQEIWERVAELILQLVRTPEYAEYVRLNARAIPWTWDRMATVWTQYWDWLLGGRQSEAADNGQTRCSECGGRWLAIADGYHCTRCGYYTLASGA